jgi:hypothetical protein
VSPPGPIRIASPRGRDARASARSSAAQGPHRFSVGVIRVGTPLSSGEPEGRSRRQTSRESAGSRDPAGSSVRESPGAPSGPSFESSRRKRMREGVGKPTLRRSSCALKRRCNPKRASVGPGFGPGGYGPPRGAKPWSCGASWSSGPQSRRARCQKQQEGNDAERRTAPRGGKALKGEPQEWYRSSRPEGRGGSKPSGE